MSMMVVRSPTPEKPRIFKRIRSCVLRANFHTTKFKNQEMFFLPPIMGHPFYCLGASIWTANHKITKMCACQIGSKLSQISCKCFKILFTTWPWPAFGRQGLVGSSGGYTYHASSRACATWLGRMVDTQFLLFIGPLEKCLEMGEI